MLVMILNGTFHLTYDSGLLGNDQQNYKKQKLNKTKFISDSYSILRLILSKSN